MKMGNKNDNCKYYLTSKTDKYFTFVYSEIKADAGGKEQNCQDGIAVICPSQRGVAFPSRNVEIPHTEGCGWKAIS